MPKLRRFFNNSIAVIIISSCIGLFMYYSAYNVIMKYVENSLVEIAKQGALVVDKDIEKYLYSMAAMARLDEIKNNNISPEHRVKALNNYFKIENILRMGIADLKGNSYTTDDKVLYIGDRDYFKRASKGERAVSSPLISRADGKLIVVFAVPIYSNDRVNGVLYSDYSAEHLSRITDNIRLGKGGNSFIIDKNGTTIAHDNRQLVYDGDNDFENVKRDPSLKKLVAIEQQMVAGKMGAASYIYNGKEKYAGYAPIGSTGWSIAVTAPKSQVFGRISNILVFMLCSIGIIIIAIALINLYLRYLKISLKKVQATSQNAIDSANIMILGIDDNGVIEDFNKYAEIKTGYYSQEVVGKKNIIDIIDISDKEKAFKMLESFKGGEYLKNVEMALCKQDGNLIHILWNYSIGHKKFMGKNIIEIMGIDITDRVLSERELIESNEQLTILYDELHNLAYHDALTHLPNRYMLEKTLQSFIEAADTRKFALLYIDCDNFKFVNDTMGHSFGNRVIINMGKRIKAIAEDNCYLFRIGGDEFYIIIPDINSENELENFADNIIKGFKEPLKTDGNSLNISISIGGAIYPDHGSSIEELIKNSDIAMYNAKDNGKGCYSIYNDAMNSAIIERLNLEKLLRKAIEKEEFVLYYQPQLCLGRDRICGFEALIRWQSPELGFVPPVKFIEIAEESGLIVPIGEWVLKKACDFIGSMLSTGYTDFTVSVNLSVLQIIQHNFIDFVDEVLTSAKIDPKYLELEITESILIESFEEINKKLEILKSKGIKIALDDFGKGYSSLSYLMQMPISTLKIDKSFIDRIIFSGNENILAGSLVHIGHKMGLNVVAEGVETEEQLEYLKNHSCDIIQGYLFSRPVPENDVIKLLKNGR